MDNYRSSMINGLIRYSMETGALTSICGIATLVSVWYRTCETSAYTLTTVWLHSLIFGPRPLSSCRSSSSCRNVSINDVKQGRKDKIVQILRALRSWEEKRKNIARSIGRSGAHVGPFITLEA